MKTSNRIQIAGSSDRRLQPVCLTGFQSILPRYHSSQTKLLKWLADVHVRTGTIGRESIEMLLSRYSASADQIAFRGSELADFHLRDRRSMTLFGPAGSDLAEKTKFFEERVNNLFERFYAPDAPAPGAIVHVTCTGYSSPSGAQRLVSSRRWGRTTQVIHAYHMGCYAAHPAIRMAAALRDSAQSSCLPVDVVHTELCSLHMDPMNHDPSQLIVQSLFADGFIKYQVTHPGAALEAHDAFLEILAARDEIIPDSTDAMRWTTGPLAFTMTLSKEVPTLLGCALPRFVASLFEEAGLNWKREKPTAVVAIHPGGPRIIELSQRILGLSPAQVVWSRRVLRAHGNMSSATLPHIWRKILGDKSVPDGTLVASVGAGPGLTLSGMLLRKRANTGLVLDR